MALVDTSFVASIVALDIEDITNAGLIKWCTKGGLSVVGNKQELFDRLQEYARNNPTGSTGFGSQSTTSLEDSMAAQLKALTELAISNQARKKNKFPTLKDLNLKAMTDSTAEEWIRYKTQIIATLVINKVCTAAEWTKFTEDGTIMDPDLNTWLHGVLIMSLCSEQVLSHASAVKESDGMALYTRLDQAVDEGGISDAVAIAIGIELGDLDLTILKEPTEIIAQARRLHNKLQRSTIPQTEHAVCLNLLGQLQSSADYADFARSKLGDNKKKWTFTTMEGDMISHVNMVKLKHKGLKGKNNLVSKTGKAGTEGLMSLTKSDLEYIMEIVTKQGARSGGYSGGGKERERTPYKCWTCDQTHTHPRECKIDRATVKCESCNTQGHLTKCCEQRTTTLKNNADKKAAYMMSRKPKGGG